MQRRENVTMEMIKNPGTARWNLTINEADFTKLKRGLRARDMDDRWVFIAMTEEELLEVETAHRAAADGAAADGATADSPTADEELSDSPAPGSPTADSPTTDEQLSEQSDDIAELLAEPEEEEPLPVDLSTGAIVSIRRTWTNTELYRLALQPSDGSTSARIETITWEQDQGRSVSEEQAQINVVLLCRSLVECDLAAAPDYDPDLYGW